LNQDIVGKPVNGTIELNRWYDIKIELAGNHIRCYLDGKLVHDVTATPPEHFFATVGRDQASHELILKAINTTAEPLPATIRLRGVEKLAGRATVTVLTASALTDNNSLDHPRSVIPMESQIDNVAAEFAHEFPPYSLTILRLKTQQH
jgi:alpha-L-arabinofuranosidase